MLLSSNTAFAQPAKPILAALGDSFASGQGAGGYVLNSSQPYTGAAVPADKSVYAAGTTETGNECFRARTAYGPIVANTKGYDLSNSNATCGGATTSGISQTTVRQVADGRTVSIAPQIDSVPSNASVVTLTIGGNDIEFVPFVQCVVTDECTEAKPATLATRAALTTVSGKVAGAINAIKAKAPNAKVIVTGYPQVVGDGAGCFAFLSSAENMIANSINTSLNTEIKRAATATAVTYVDLYKQGSFGNNSSACSLSPLQQLFPNQPTRKISAIEATFLPANFHPNLFGQRAMAELVGAVVS